MDGSGRTTGKGTDMYQLIQLILEITAFKKGPEDMPHSKWLMRLLAGVYWLISFIVLWLSVPAGMAFLQSCLQMFLVMAACWIILFFAGKQARYLQTVSALLGTDALISFFAIPALASLAVQPSALGFVAVMLLMVWSWAVTGYIFSHALSKPILFGLGVAFLYILASYQIIELLFPQMTNISGE